MLINRYKLYLSLFLTAFWLACCWGFVADELLPPLHKYETVKLLLVDSILVVLGCACIRTRFDIIAIISFLILSVVSTFLINHEGIMIYFNGFRDFIGLLLVVPIFRYFLTYSYATEFKRFFYKT